jgi:hypothetical protein
MAVLPSPQSTHKFYQADGVTPAAAYEVYTYAAGTTTPLATYSDAAGVSANTNPIILNSNGEASIYVTAGVSYDLVLKYPGGGAQIGATQRVIVDGDTAVRSDLSGSSGSSLVGFLQAGTGAVARTSQDKMRETVSVKDFGALGNGVANDAAAFQAAVTYLQTRRGGTVFVPNGHYKVGATTSIDRSANSALGRVSIVGESEFGTWIEYTGSGVCFDIKNNDTALGEQAASYQQIGNFLLTGQSSTGTGISVNLGAFIDIRNINIQGFQYGIDAIDVDQSILYRVKCRFNARGIRMRKNPSPGVSSTQPNNILLVSCNLSNNTDYGGHFIGGACITMTGGAVETNGSSGASGFGLHFEDCGYEGGVGANLTGVYFESNNGIADLILDGNSGSTITAVTHSLTGVSFNRASATSLTTNCIKADFGATATHGLQKLAMTGVSFKSYGAYTPNASRKYVAFTGAAANKDNFVQLGCIYEDSAEVPTFLQNVLQRYAKLTKAANQTLTTGVQATWTIDTVASNFSWTPSISSGVVTIDEAGYYAIDAFVVFSSAAAGIKKVLFYRNGTLIGYGEGSQDAVTAATTEIFAAGDTMTIQVVQSTGGNLDIVASLSKAGVVKQFD